MNIAVLCAVSFLLTLATWLYTAGHGLEEQDNPPAVLSKQVLFASKARLVYLAVMLICLIAISVSLNLIYPANELIHNLKMIILLGLLFAAAEIDYREHIIPNKLILAGLAMRTVFWIAELLNNFDRFLAVFKDNMIGCILIALFFVIGVLLVKDGLGMGDIKLMLIMCLYQGFSGVVSALFFSLTVAFVISVALLLVRKKTRRDSIAFAPAILVGTLISVFMTGM